MQLRSQWDLHACMHACMHAFWGVYATMHARMHACIIKKQNNNNNNYYYYYYFIIITCFTFFSRSLGSLQCTGSERGVKVNRLRSNRGEEFGRPAVRLQQQNKTNISMHVNPCMHAHIHTNKNMHACMHVNKTMHADKQKKTCMHA